MDDLYTSLFRELLTYMIEDSAQHHLLHASSLMAKNLERIGDHTTTSPRRFISWCMARPWRQVRPKRDRTSLAYTPDATADDPEDDEA